ncbi:unnamed protein product [Paramecium sonneborni]|uniref:Uncharacterized protein n=1 Tax=Paramecium sonneborni TaxID=65129 RepID=A0A8S1MJK5_9CILI|nr:unnamed protein product [Paramecium sonneborni]
MKNKNILFKMILFKTKQVAFCKCCQKDFDYEGDQNNFIQDHSISLTHVQILTKHYLKSKFDELTEKSRKGMEYFELERALSLQQQSKSQFNLYLSQMVDQLLSTFSNLALNTIDCYKSRLLSLFQFLVKEGFNNLNT